MPGSSSTARTKTPQRHRQLLHQGRTRGLCLDLALRAEGHCTLDDVMRALWQRCAGGPMDEATLRAVLQELGGRPFDTEIDAWVHGTGELPLEALLAAHGITLKPEAAQPAQRLGLRVAEDTAVQVKTVLRGGLAERAGMAAGDEWIGIEVQGQGWRITKLDEIALYAGTETSVTALVARDRRLLRLPLALPSAHQERQGPQERRTARRGRHRITRHHRRSPRHALARWSLTPALPEPGYRFIYYRRTPWPTKSLTSAPKPKRSASSPSTAPSSSMR